MRNLGSVVVLGRRYGIREYASLKCDEGHALDGTCNAATGRISLSRDRSPDTDMHELLHAVDNACRTPGILEILIKIREARHRRT